MANFDQASFAKTKDKKLIGGTLQYV